MTASGASSSVIQHHVPDEALLAHAAGTATDAASLAIACHAGLCDRCSARVAELEAVGGALLETAGTAALPPDALASVLARSTVLRTGASAAASPEVPELLPYGLPRPLRAAIGRVPGPVRWRLVIPGVRAIDLPVGSGEDVVRLIAFKGGITIPLHDHGGAEHIVVFSGALEEEGARSGGRHLHPRVGRTAPAAGRAWPALHRAGRQRRQAATVDPARAHSAGPVAKVEIQIGFRRVAAGGPTTRTAEDEMNRSKSRGVMMTVAAMLGAGALLGACSSDDGGATAAGGHGGSGATGGTAGGARRRRSMRSTARRSRRSSTTPWPACWPIARSRPTSRWSARPGTTVARLKSCLRLQFTALFGGPATYPGVNDEGDTCVDMVAIHAGLGIPGAVFDKFVMDFGGVLKADGVADADIATIAGAVTGLQGQIVASTPVAKSACDAGAAQ